MIAILKEWASTFITLAAAISVMIGAMAYFAKASELQALREEVVLTQVRLDQKIVSDNVISTRNQIILLEERNIQYGPDCSKWPDERDRKQYKELKADYEELLEQKKQMKKK